MNETLEYIFDTFKPTKGRKLPWIIEDIDRESIPKMLGELGFKEGVEVGVAQGNHAKTLCENIPDVHLYCVDVWDRYSGYREYTNRIRKYWFEAQERLLPYNCTFIKAFSMDAVGAFKNGSLYFGYIDAAHDLKNFTCDVWEWSKKVRHGGVVFGHDYKFHSGKGRSKYIVHVKHGLQCYCYVKSIDPWFELRIPRQRSWMFVRQEGDLV